MSEIVSKIDKIEGWWWHLSTDARWFVATLSAALVLGVGGGFLS